ncbi:hypothetical protein [uncultured Methanobrevibacter sp.]|uniref:hypothetical protein n=1 Tax=uncultured Methanobrevibacter sp. TaxID=253161 RepID=UPI0025F38847|nr:hypothetical protein [uncultured Methanobrevibacter sp.]
MYTKIKEEALKHNIDYVIDGNNISDFLFDRPGILAKYKHNIGSPLIEAEMETRDVYRYLNENNIAYFKSTTCLATRIKTNTSVNSENINMVKNAEKELEKIVENNVFKVRNLDRLALIESEKIDVLLNENILQLIESKLRNIGFNKVAINLSYMQNDEEKLFDPIEYESEGKIINKVKLPYPINIENTKDEIEKSFSNVELKDNGRILKFRDEEVKIIINDNGEIEIRKTNDKEEEQIFIEILKRIRRRV